MDHIKILKRAFNITVNYRVLWIFGFLLALTGAGAGPRFSGSGSTGGGSGNGKGFPGNIPNNPFNQFPHLPALTPDLTNTIIGIAIGVACFFLLLAIIATVVRLVSTTAVMRMVDKYETDGEQVTFRQGWKLGWSNAAWKIFLLDLVVGLGSAIIFLVLLGLLALPLLVWLTPSLPLRVLGTIISVGLILLLLFATFLVGLALGLVMLFAERAIAIEDLGVFEGFRRGYELVKGRLMDTILMGIMMFGIGLVWAILMIPVFLVLLVAAALIAALPALLVGGIVGLFTQGATPWIVAAIVAAPVFLLTIAIPGALINGWQLIFSSSAWTLTFRETRALLHTDGAPEAPVITGPETPAAPSAA